jgi:hypothetical protein
VSATPDMPHGPEAVTASWLSSALSTRFPGTEVAEVEVLAQHSGTTGRMRLGLEYAQGCGGPATLFVKLPPLDPAQQELVAATGMGRREARFYEGPARETPKRIPEVYFAAHGDRSEYVMVLEDLEASGCTFTSRSETHADEFGLALMESLARLHAHFWNDPRFDDELSWIRPAMRGGHGAKLVANAREMFADQFPPVFDALCELYIENDERICELWDVGEQTLIHGDTHSGNQFIDGDRIGLYDWAVISRSPWIRDVSIFLGNSCPTDVRRREQENWIRAYRQVLVDEGVDAPSFETLWERFRLGALYAWVASTTTASMGDRWQPIEVGMRGMTQATDTCADIETVEAFREAL